MDPWTPPPVGPGASMPPPLPAFLGQPGTAMFSLGDILGQTFSIYKANFLAFVIIMVVVSIPAIACAVLATSVPWAAFFPGLIAWVTTPIGTGAITFGVYEYLSGRSTTVGDCLRVGFAKLLPVIGVALLTGLIIGIGIIACVVPGLIALAVFALAVPVAVQEKTSVVDALRRSSQLTEGFRWTILGLYFLIFVINAVLVLPVNLSFTFSGHPEYALVATQVASILASALGAIAPAVMYYRLRSIKESLDVRDIASVFA